MWFNDFGGVVVGGVIIVWRRKRDLNGCRIEVVQKDFLRKKGRSRIAQTLCYVTVRSSEPYLEDSWLEPT
jgi:hypothetical protein